MLTARMCQRRLGFAVQVAPSGVEHPTAGNGLWLSGQAEPGAIVALYPGIVYPALHYKYACRHLLAVPSGHEICGLTLKAKHWHECRKCLTGLQPHRACSM